ncbi:MAG TPA: ABC transporter permease [Candidatus Limnocylindria bacterium]|nr:ABC transporter permease [Candidatus Limnocylindria bacterium]
MTFPEVGVKGRTGVRVPARRPFRARHVRAGDLAIRIASVAGVLAVWELFGPALNPIILRPPSAIVAAFGELLETGELQAAMFESLRVFSVGLVIALAAGIVLGVLTGRSRLAFNLLDPWVSALYSVPSVALVPLIAVAFRYQGEAPRIATVALFAVFPILINTQQGVRNVDVGLLEVARAFSSSERRLWRDVVVPAATPFILAGVRLAIGRALIGMIISEFLVGLRGLGYLIIVYQNTFRIDKMFVPVIVVAAIGVALMGLVQVIEGRVAPWARREP